MKKSLIALTALAAAGCAMASSRRDYDEQARGHELRALNAGGLEADLFAKKALVAAMAPCDGRAISLVDQYAVTANPTAGDVILLARIPAGTEVSIVQIQATDMDTNGAPTIVFRAGYRACNSSSSLAADSTYFAAAGQTLAQAGGRLNCSFVPIVFEEDVYLTVTINTASATFATGTFTGIVIGSSNGPK